MTDKLFSTAQDQQILTGGGIICQACLMGKPLDDVSTDPRYCLGCYEFLVNEAELLHPRASRPEWLPVGAIQGKQRIDVLEEGWINDKAFFVTGGQKYGITKTGETACAGPVSGAKETLPVKQQGVTKTATVPLSIPQDVTPLKTATNQPLTDKIKALDGWEDQGSRTIAQRLEKEGVIVCHMTVSRALRSIKQGVLVL